MRLVLATTLLLVACGGPATSAPPSTTADGPRPVRVDEAPEASADGPRPVRLAPTTPGEASESDELASPPPVEAPTGPR